MNNQSINQVPFWASWIGIIIVVMGVYLTASYGNQLMKYWVLDGVPSVEKAEYQYKCPEDELEEEGITLEMCKQKTANVDTILLSVPEWFRGFQIVLMTIGTLLAFGSIFAGVALVEYKSTAPMATIFILSSLFLIDILGVRCRNNNRAFNASVISWRYSTLVFNPSGFTFRCFRG